MEEKNPFEGVKTYDNYTHLWQLTAFVFFLQILAGLLSYLFARISGFKLTGLEIFILPMLISVYVCWVALEGLGVSWAAAMKDWDVKARKDVLKALKYFGGYILLMASIVALVIALFSLFGIDESVLENAPDMFDALMAESAASAPRYLLLLFMSCALTPVMEELLFRRIMFTTIRRKSRFWPSALISGLLFALFHGETALMVFPVGLYFCWVYEREQRLPVNIMLHGLINMSVTVFKTLA